MTDLTTPSASPLPADVAGLVEHYREKWAALMGRADRLHQMDENVASLVNAICGHATDLSDLTAVIEAQARQMADLTARAEKAEAENAELRKAPAKSLLETGRDLLVELAEMQARAEKAEADRQTFETACINAVADRREATDELLREREARQKAEAEVERLREAGTALASHSQLAVNCGWLENFEELTAWIAAMKGENNG